jgi:DNA-binding transcriptional MerR regulator
VHSMDEMMRAGCTTRRGVRYWEEQGLLGDVERTEGETRRYTDDQLNRARVIAAAQFGGWKLDEIREMVENYDSEVYSALLTRLADQTRAAVRLGDQLPRPAAPTEYDL